MIQQLNGNRSKVEIGREKVSEQYARSQAEIGVGGQYALTKKLSIYGDAQYRFSLDGNRTAIYRQSEQSKQSYNARVGVKYSW